MPVSNFRKNFFRLLIVSVTLVAGACSIKDSMKDCPPAAGERTLLYLRISDVLTGSDITATETLEDITLYLFDADRELMDTIPVSMSQIRNGIPVDLTEMDMEGGYAVVWANIGVGIAESPSEHGSRMEDLEFSMLLNPLRDDYYSCPGDMFFGLDRLNFVPVSENVRADTVKLMRKNARLNVTVRGLPEGFSPDDYYFRIGALYSAYNFAGTPQAEDRNIWETGDDNANGDFVSPEPYIMIHHPSGIIYDEENSLYIHLMRGDDITRVTDVEIARANRDIDGNYIVLNPGMTTNVLIELIGDGEIQVQVSVTPWDEIIQWTEW